MQGSARKDVVFGAARGYTFTVPGPKWKSWLKAWTFWRLIRTDILDRGIPWIELILRSASMPDDLNVQVSQRISVVLVYLLSLSALALAIYWQGVFLVPLLCIAFLLISNYWLFGWASSADRRRPLAWTAAGLGVSILLAYWQQMLPLIPALATALAAILLWHRFLRDRATGKANKAYSVLLGLVIAASGVYILSHCCPVKSRIESIGWGHRGIRFGSRMAGVPVKRAFFRIA